MLEAPAFPGVTMFKINYIMFDITNRCNFKCKHCYKDNPSNPIDLDVGFIEQFIYHADDIMPNPHIILSGGEPLMYQKLYDLLDSIGSNHKIRINTNAYYLDEHIEKLLKYKNIELQISLDGFDDKSFFSIRNNHYFPRVLNNACSAKQKGLSLFFRTTLTSKTIPNYQRFITLSKESEIPLILRPIINTGTNDQKPLALDYATIHQWQKECTAKGLTRYSGESIVSPHCPLLGKDTTFSTLTVDVFGNVYPCMLLKNDKFYMGNIITDNFDEIFDSCTDVKNTITDILHFPQCQACGFRDKFGDGTCVISCFLKNQQCIKHVFNII